MKCHWPSQRMDEKVEVRVTPFPQVGKLFLKADELQVGQWHENVERKWEYCHIIIFPKRI